MTKIIFLDIDGVLNTDDDPKPIINGVDPANVFHDIPRRDLISNLNHIINETGANVVISSTWRKHAHWGILWRLFQVLGFEGKIIDSTPVDGDDRGQQIKQWLEDENTGKHICLIDKLRWNIKIEKVVTFVILDDLVYDIISHEDLKNNTVATDPSHGLTIEKVREAIKILNGERK